ncbi:MAG TPA: Fic family protein [Methylomirabilota bacterium]|nr:Fic family protein [Methylomirabilota bacterium]
MNFRDFKSGVLKQQYEYRSFSPALVNQTWIWDDPKINTLLEEATRSLGELNGLSLIIPDIDLFIRMHVLREAQTSSRIEGTVTTMAEAVMPRREDIDPEKRDDWQEVQNYVDAMNSAIVKLETLPLSNRLLRDTHAILMRGVRGQHKTPGEFRRSQNWIGGATLADASFIPPHHEELPDLLSDLEKFWHNATIDVPHLIRVGISHYQFETIHPFQDGNGRIGRLLITLYLVSKGLLAKPCLYLSEFFEKHRGEYYDALTQVRVSNDLAHWVKFFLVAVNTTATRGIGTFRKIVQIQKEVDDLLPQFGKRSANARQLVQLLYRRPRLTARAASEELGLSIVTSDKLLVDFVGLGLLVEKTGRRRGRIYEFQRYFRLFVD